MKVELTVEETTEDITLEISPVGLPGPRGFSAFEVWQRDNPNATLEDYYAFLKGDPFEYKDFTPEQLESLKVKGDKGDSFTFDDFTPEQIESLKVKGDQGDPFTYEDFTPEQLERLKVKGDPGPSPYQVAVANGFEGTETQWLASLKGERGNVPTEEINAFLSNFFDPSIVALNARAENVERKLRFVQNELDALEVEPSLYTTMATTSVGKLQSVLPSSGEGDFTVERNSEATKIDKDGVMRIAPPNVPRIDWSTGEPMLLRERWGMNLARNSVNATGNVSKNGAPILVLSELHPDEPTYNYLPDNSVLQYTYISEQINPLTTYTLSVFVEMNDGSAPIPGSSSAGSKDFRIVISNGSTDESSYRVEHIYGSVYRVSGSRTIGENTQSNHGVYKQVGMSNKGFRILGYQFEEGPVATSYIPTVGARASRLSDKIYRENASDFIGQSEGTMFLDYDGFPIDESLKILAGVFRYNTSMQNSIGFAYFTGQFFIFLRSSTNYIAFNYLGAPSGGRNKIAISYTPNAFSVAINGVIRVNNESITGLPIEMSVVKLDGYSEGSQNNHRIKDFALYKEALSDEQLIAMTTI